MDYEGEQVYHDYLTAKQGLQVGLDDGTDADIDTDGAGTDGGAKTDGEALESHPSTTPPSPSFSKEKNMNHGGGERALAVVATATGTELQQVLSFSMSTALLTCHTCRLPLKSPVFKCDADHLLCSSCRELHGEEPCGLTVVHFAFLDAFVASVMVRCDFEKYGCHAGGIVYHESAEHRRACPHAPCGCPARASDGGGCGFIGSKQKLLDHITGSDGHSRPTICIPYGPPRTLNLPVSCGWHVLVDKAAAGVNRHRNLFLVSLGQHGPNISVSLLCVRADGGDPAPQFACELSVERSARGTIHMVKMKSPQMSSSSLSGGAPAPGDGEYEWLRVPKEEYLSGDTVPISIYIEMLSPAASTPPPLLAIAAAPPCPTEDTNKPATTYQSNGKKRKSASNLQ
ncbi:E3 ubiquitin-protein ligase SINA-like 8 [Aegilops tauschii subsp. strangulata]|uniref:E3 ubiquitin-protein ligase SINA-like 8 n=1 Tax=Aegilops tauschii subsp. strangulata TaxID=200361 RepID=UPI001E1C9F55|nr:E3 ubiquitin-protein ligase SINA-like 8 [Aegilops tauschii subsp. strangulata]